ncbi:cell division regulator GpsB [Pseudalkalibacillus caeni]|uniref:Cell cycle protein GpsB n=1 Tax=Exobacillus caeni TaxID=2574798 RepID=A0A5R9EYR5_9BACL|nr:cell division regulator GpsB [Pseudalkalibacillus caeni]TLS35210.1 cell division regulator GpsB [Pseudalkalibacillus caeni]
MVTDQSMQLTAKEILEKDFKSGFRGYDQDEVDKFLDMIIKDYERFEKELEKMKQENGRLRREIERLSEQQKKQQTQPGNTNYDILKRLSNLEKHVFGSKLYE